MGADVASASVQEDDVSASQVLRRVTFIIVTYQSRPHIAACLRSLMGSSEETPRVIVVDNASSDGTEDLVREEFPDVQVLSAGQNLGYGHACNLGAQVSETDFLAIMNPDIISTPNWSTHLARALDEDQSAALATPKILLKSDPTRINACGNAPHYTGITPCRGYNQPTSEFVAPEEVAAVSGAAFVVRRTVFEALGGIDPSFFLYLEDTDLSFRASLAGYRCLYVPDAVVLHDFEPRFSADKVFFLERNRHVMLLKIYHWRTLLTLTPALLVTELAVCGYSVLRGPSWLLGKARAYVWLAGHFRRILRARRQAQDLRRVADRTLIALCTADLHLDELGRTGYLAMTLINPLLRGWNRVARLVISW